METVVKKIEYCKVCEWVLNSDGTCINGCNGEREKAAAELFEALQKLVNQWRAKADGEYCQTYNKGMAQGLHEAANDLEALFIEEA